MSSEQQQLEAGIQALEAQRSLLGDAVVDMAVAPLKARLAALSAPPASAVEPAQTLKQVSILFLDVVGSTALSQHLDPEDVSAVMDGLLACGTEIVIAHGGRVLQYAGDNILAAFGSERAEEDDAERAVHCGLALLQEGQRLGERVLREHGQAGCHVRVGIHTGPVLLGGGVDEEGTIRGLTVNIAARMEQTAPVGTLRISQDTWLQVRGSFACESQPPLQVKGRDEPILTYLVQRALPRAERVMARGIDGVATPLVGRDAELAQLLAARDAVLAQRAPQALTLLGEPGLGKSRLLAELQAGLSEAGPGGAPWWLLRGRTHPQTRLQPYGLLRDLLHVQLQIADSDSADTARAKLEEGLAPWLGEGDAVQAQAHRLGQLLGMDFATSPWVHGQTPQQLRRAGFAALRAWLAALARDGSAVALLIEDLHWADDGSLDFITELAALQQPLLLVASTRPELLQRRPDWGQALPQHRTLVLQALPPATGQVLADALLHRLQGDPQFDTVRARLLQHAGGNPFYMEELVRMLRDDGVLQQTQADTPGAPATWRLGPRPLALARMPTTLVGVLQARLDALPAADRQALQQASIVGPVFWDEALAALDPAAPRAIPTLRGRALVRQQAQSAFEGTTEEAFAHHLLQQVTYDTVLKTARRAGHAAAAQWLAERVGERASEYLATTAEHYERAGDHERAFEYIVRAARSAEGRYANATAIEYTGRALAIPGVAADPRKRCSIYLIRTWLFDLVGRRTEQQQCAEAWEQAARELGDDGELAAVLFAQAMLASRRSDEAGSLALALQAIDAGERGGNLAIAAQALGQVAWVRHTEGRNDEALVHSRTALARIRATPADGSVRQRALFEEQLTALLGMIELAAGQPGAALRTLHHGLALARQRGNQRSVCHMLESISSIAYECGRYDEALALNQQQMELGKAMGVSTTIGWAHHQIGRTLTDLGRHDEAAAHLDQAAALAQQNEDRQLRSLALARRARITAPLSSAVQLFDEAQQVLSAKTSAGAQALLLTWRAEVELDAGELDAARRTLDAIDQGLQSATFAVEEEARLRGHWLRHRILAATGELAAARAQLQQAQALLHSSLAGYDDDTMRRDALERVALHRDIVKAWAAAQVT